MSGKAHILRGRGKQPYRFHVKARNGRILCHGEGHPTAAKARRALKTLILTITDAALEIVDHTKKRGQP